jgi:hypothetical protein
MNNITGLLLSHKRHDTALRMAAIILPYKRQTTVRLLSDNYSRDLEHNRDTLWTSPMTVTSHSITRLKSL